MGDIIIHQHTHSVPQLRYDYESDDQDGPCDAQRGGQCSDDQYSEHCSDHDADEYEAWYEAQQYGESYDEQYPESDDGGQSDA